MPSFPRPSLSRRDLLRGTALTALGAAATSTLGAFGGSASAAGGPSAPGDPWARATYISAQVRGPRFPHRWFDVTEYGAVGDGTTKNTAAFAAAVQACHDAGGGHVVVPDGDFLTGAIHLLSNVDLHVTGGARIRFSQDPADFLPVVLTRFEGVELYNYSPLIYAHGQQNIGVTGSGVLDGQADADHWWPWASLSADKNQLNAMAEAGVPVDQRVFGGGHYLRPAFIEPHSCSNVVISGIRIEQSPMWEIHPTLSDHVLVENVTISTHGPNNDGCDPECSRMVVIRGCTFDTGDDCIAIKSGKNADGRRVNTPSEDVLVEGCTMRDGHGGVTIGSEMTGGVRNVFVRDCQMSSPNLDIALRFKTNSMRGGFIRDYHARDLTVGQVASAVVTIDFNYGEGAGHGFLPDVGGIDIADVTVGNATRGLDLQGYPEDHIDGVHLTRVDLGTTTEADIVTYVDNLVLDQVTENGAPLTQVG